MAAKTIPIPPDPIGENYSWRDWLQKLSNKVYGSVGSQDSNAISITGGSISGTTIDLITAIQNVNITAVTNGQVLSYNTASLKWVNTTSSGTGTVTSVACTVPSIFSIAGSPITTSGTLALTYSGTALPIANGGTNSTALATAGGAGYGTGTAHAYTAAGVAGQILTSGGAAVPAWVTLLPLANGGTNSAAAATAGGVGYGTGTAHAYTAAGVAGQIVTSGGAGVPAFVTLLPIANGGTNSAAVATAGGVGYGTGTAHAYTAAGVAGQIVTSGGAGVPAFVTLLPIANGGTNSAAVATAGGIGYGTGTAHAYTAAGTAGQIVTSGGAGVPAFVTILPIANGGTNSSATPTAGGIVYGSGTARSVTAAGTSGQYLKSAGAGVPTWGSISTVGTTVAGLPAGVVGDRGHVTDALAPAFGSAVVGGGAVVIPVFRNATVWVVG